RLVQARPRQAATHGLPSHRGLPAGNGRQADVHGTFEQCHEKELARVACGAARVGAYCPSQPVAGAVDRRPPMLWTGKACSKAIDTVTGGTLASRGRVSGNPRSPRKTTRSSCGK